MRAQLPRQAEQFPDVAFAVTPTAHEPLAGRSKVTGQNIRHADPIIAKEPVGRLRIGRVLASPRRRRAYPGRQLLQYLPKSLAAARIPELTAYNFAIDPFLPTEILRRFP